MVNKHTVKIRKKYIGVNKENVKILKLNDR